MGSVLRSQHAWWVRIIATLLLFAALGGALNVQGPQRVSAAPRDPTPTPLATDAATPTVTPSASPAVTPIVTTGIGAASAAPPPGIAAAAAELYDQTTGKTLYALAPDVSLPMASTTKIMTAVVALTYGKLDQQITIGPDVVAIENGGTSVAGLRLGEKLSLRELLYCLMVPSGDDAAIAIADGIAGSQDKFVALMNLEAGLLGLSHTHYANPHGLDAPGHYTSVSDLVKLTAYAMSSPTFTQVVDTSSITLPATATHHEFQLVNTNELLANQPFAYDGAVGVKTGYTGGAGYCLVFMARRPSGVLIGALLGEPTYNGRFTDAAALMHWAYNSILAPATPGATSTATATAAATAGATPGATASTTP